MAVKTDLVKEFLVGGIHAIVAERLAEPLLPETEIALIRSTAAVIGDAASGIDENLAARIARAGYLARVAETELFEPARDPTTAFADELSLDPRTTHDTASVSARLARRESVQRPDPQDEHAMTWRIPGPGGHVRHYVALTAIDWLTNEAAGRAISVEDTERLKRCWLCGFFLRCCEEVLEAH